MKILKNLSVLKQISVVYLPEVKSKFKNSSIAARNDYSKIAIFSRFSFKETEQNLNDHNSAKSARKIFKFKPWLYLGV